MDVELKYNKETIFIITMQAYPSWFQSLLKTYTLFIYVTVSASNHIPQKNFDNFSFYHRSPTAVKIKLETAKQFSHLFQSDSLAPSRIC